MKYWLICTTRRLSAVLAGLWLLTATGAQPLHPHPPTTFRTPNRWLLIIETSRATQTRAQAVAQIAGNLVLSGMNDQMRPGDTLGLWTFDSTLHRGGFPLQIWNPANAKTIAQRLGVFLAHQKFEGRPVRNGVFPAMSQVISNSPYITVVLITSGGETFSGTPFDKAINTIHHQWQSRQEKARQPFLTMLRAQQAQVTDFEVSRPPEPVEFPPLPPELLITNPVAQKLDPPKPVEVAPAPIVENLILHGKKPEPVASPPAATVAVVATNAPANLPPTNLVSQSQTGNFNPTSAPPTPLIAAMAPTAVTPVLTRTAESPAVVTPAQATGPAHKIFWFVGLAATLVILGLVLKRLRQTQAQPRVSLITRSLDRQHR